MITLVIGGSASGKSKYAEDLAENVTCDKFYIATMLPNKSDVEVRAKIEAHQKMRRDKQFTTCEYYNCEKICTHTQSSDVVLLECVSNLLANEMFAGETVCYSCVELVIACIEQLACTTKHLIIVSNDIFHDGSDYDECTLQYISQLGLINQKLAQMADNVIEVVYSIPIQIKGAI